ncbi:ImmA/IrrE family metallo-endopeptidase [Amycolatopsis sp. NBC_01307]|uniref:ImmA/IrrE family metallo-endopeptidase n=1 Tax=Amycolatopsis sp. NBC_01307 TaxID=2903561 RepID=UPI002E0D68C1|nr:ImmA/IrrE family metallo-endopeptidase [Amycolatopsis sp. NBC_01307]
MNGTSGITTNAGDAQIKVFINANEPPVRQRFSLLHEFKHVLDFDFVDTLHESLGSGDLNRRARQIELICNEFAACALMPANLVKRVWLRTQNIELAAGMFNVSPEAMSTRLSRLGLIGVPAPAPKMYFRRQLVSLCVA